ncbi:cytidylate kinase-like family protein [Desulfosediminicola flagellatus]|nr:cytidylate kinase-like family protein [Desulfosediminicola flagellatus]
MRIISDIEDRINEEVRHDNISTTKALYLLKKEDEEYRN